MYKYAIIVAGGSGTRMGTDMPKQFLLLNGKPVLWHSVKAFTDAYPDIEIIIVLPKNHLTEGESFVKEFSSHRVRIVEGGRTRFHSVGNGLQTVERDSIVFVHDGVRCLVSQKLIQRCYEIAVAKGNAIPAVKSKDSLRIVDEDKSRILDRNHVVQVQTPQTFVSRILKEAFKKEYNDNFTDEAAVIEAAGFPVILIEGEESNIKITRPFDLVIAERIIETEKK